MPTATDRWEQGSEFHRLEVLHDPCEASPPWSAGGLLGSGRDALRILARHGLATRGWRRFWVPSYLCQEVVAAIAAEGPPLASYPDLPDELLVLPAATPGDAVLVVNTFGLRSGPSPTLPPGVDLVEDHTHDPTSPWAHASWADFAVASLRKTLPVPEGGALWSPRGHALPAASPVTVTRRRAAEAKREAMELKARYLSGERVEKADFRRLALAGEAEIASGEVSAITAQTAAQLASFPFSRWRDVRSRNHAYFAARLAHLTWLRVLQPEAAHCVPFSGVLVVDDPGRRERLLAGLIAHRVYPAILWPLEKTEVPVPETARALSRRIVSIHCDFRYDEDDLARVAAIVEKARGA